MAIREVLEFTTDLVVEPIQFGADIIQAGYSAITGKTINQPFNVKHYINDTAEILTGKKLYTNIPTSKDLNDPQALINLYLKSANQNDKEGMQATLDLVKHNPQVAIPLVNTIKKDFYNRMQAVIDGKARPEDGVIAVRELNQLLELGKDYAPYLTDIINLTASLNNPEVLKQYPELSIVKSNFERYNTLNKIFDYIDYASLGVVGAGAILKRIFTKPLQRAFITSIQTAGSITPIVSGVVEANVNREGILQTMSPWDLFFGIDAYKGVKEIGKLKNEASIGQAYEELKSPDFNPTSKIAENLSKNYKLTNEDLENIKLSVMMAENKEISKSDTIMQAISKNLGEMQTVLWSKLLSTKSVEESMLKEDRLYVEAFLNHEPVVKLINQGGKIDINPNELERALAELAENDQVVQNFMKYNRQRKVLSELIKAKEEGNTEVALSLGGAEDMIISLNTPLKSIIDEVEKAFAKGDVVSITYNNSKGFTVSKTIKPYYVPTNDEFRIVKGKVQYLEGDKWTDIRDETFTIPLSRTHDIYETIKEIAKAKGYDDVKISEAVYMKPATDIFPHKLEEMAKRLLQAEESLLKTKDKITEREIKDYNKVIETAYKNGFLSKEIPIEDYLKENPQAVLRMIKDNMYRYAKNIVNRNKEITGINEGYIINEGSAFFKIASNYRDLASKFITSKQVDLRNIAKLTDTVDKSAKLFNATADLLKYLTNTPYRDMKREGEGFATVFDNYESFKAYATLKYLQPTFANMKAMPFLHKFLDELDAIEKGNPHGLNPTQKLIKNFLNMYLNRDIGQLAKAQRVFGNLLTMLNPAVALGNFVAGFQSLHVLFPSLQIAKIGELKNEFRKEMRKMLYTEGMYKYNMLNPTFIATEALLRAHVLANVKNDEIFNNVILDYAKRLGIQDADVIKALKATYINRREDLADDIVDYITGLDARALQTFAIEFGKIGENIMPWYRFVFTPFSIAINAVKDMPDYIQRLGVGKAIGKPLAFSAFTAIALGAQAVPFLSPVETPFAIAKSFINTIALLFGEEDIIKDKNITQLVLKELDYHVLRTGLFDPNERINFYTSFGSALLQAIAGAEAQGWDTNPFIHSLKVGLDIISKISASGIISPSAVSYTAEIPFPALSLIQSIAKKTMFATDDLSKTNQLILATIQSIPITNNIYKEIVGKSLVRGVGESGKEDIWQPSLPAELLTKEGQGVLGLLHLIGFIALHADAVLNGNELQKMYDLFKYELATDKGKVFSPVKHPENTDYYKLLNLKDYTPIASLSAEDIIATLKYIPENEQPKVKDRLMKLMTKSLSKSVDMLRQEHYTTAEIEELKNRYKALQNFLITAEYFNWNDNDIATLKQINKLLYNHLKTKGIEVDYKDIIRAKRKIAGAERIGTI